MNSDVCFTCNHFNCDLVSILNFELVVCNACPKQKGQAAPSQKQLLSKAVFASVLQYSHRKIQNSCLRIKRTSQQLTISICVPRMVWPTYLQRNNLGEASLLLRTRKFVEEMKQEYRSTARSQRPEVFDNDNIRKFVFLPRVRYVFYYARFSMY